MRRVLGPISAIFALLLIGLAGPAGAQAAITATITIQPDGAGQRVVATLATDKPLATKARPTGVSITLKGKVVALTKVAGTTKSGAPGTWRSAVLKGKQATAATGLLGKKVSLKVKATGGTKTVKGLAGLPGTDGNGGGGGNGGAGGNGGTTPGPTPAPVVPTPAPVVPTPVPAPKSLFGNPPTALTGQPALDAIKSYFLDSTFTDCVTGWPTCNSFEDRYSGWSDGQHFYCHLTPTSGPDVYSRGTNLTFTGASQETSGAWAISYAIDSYGTIAYYRWDVSPQGVAAGNYWYGTNVTPANSAPTRTMTGFQWIRQRKDCTY